MDKFNAWQNSAIVIGIFCIISSIIYAITLGSLIVFIVSGLITYTLCLLIYGIGTLIEQNDIIIDILNKQKK